MNIDSFLKTDKSIDVYGKDEFNSFHTHVPHLHKIYIGRVCSAWDLFLQLKPNSASKLTTYIEQ